MFCITLQTVRGIIAGGSVVCVLPGLSVRDLNQPGPTPRSLECFHSGGQSGLAWHLFTGCYIIVLSIFIRSDAAVSKLHTIRPTLLPPLAVTF